MALVALRSTWYVRFYMLYVTAGTITLCQHNHKIIYATELFTPNYILRLVSFHPWNPCLCSSEEVCTSWPGHLHTSLLGIDKNGMKNLIQWTVVVKFACTLEISRTPEFLPYILYDNGIVKAL